MISGLIGGRLSDSFPYRSKRIILVALIAMIAGNLQYMFGGSVVNLIMGRVVCGKHRFTSSSFDLSPFVVVCLQGSALVLGPLYWQKWAGRRQPVKGRLFFPCVTGSGRLDC